MYYSQPETRQDEWVIKTLGNVGCMSHYFVEVGAYDGVYHSNTLALENLGWRGLLIEALAQYALKARLSRTSPVANVAIGPDDSVQDFFVAEQWSGIKTLTRPNLLEGHAKFGNSTIRVKTAPLHLVLEAYKAPQIIDYLSLDAEGAEYAILESFFRHTHAFGSRYTRRWFRCMTVEVGVNQDDLGRLVDMLDIFGYKLDKVRAWDAFFVHKDLVRVVE